MKKETRMRRVGGIAEQSKKIEERGGGENRRGEEEQK